MTRISCRQWVALQLALRKISRDGGQAFARWAELRKLAAQPASSWAVTYAEYLAQEVK